jgi:hypothetical protein
MSGLKRLSVKRLSCCGGCQSNDVAEPTILTEDEIKALRVEKVRRWSESFLAADPRHQILEYFRPGDHRGPLGLLKALGEKPAGDHPTSSFFSIWRPTSMDALRMMMEGRATGKSLNVKGKSAKQGRLSGFVPYVQIHLEKDKRKVCTPPPGVTVRVFWPSVALRDAAHSALSAIMAEMVSATNLAEEALAEEKRTGVDMDDPTREAHLTNMRWLMSEPKLVLLDGSGPGMEMPERLFVEAFVMRQDVTRAGEWETGRPSEPDYLDLNLHSTRHATDDQPRVVVYQSCEEADAVLKPQGLLVAYEEHRKVLPVASDLDAWSIGSRGVVYPNMPVDQLPFLESLLRNINKILSTPGARGWTHRWLEVLKGDAKGVADPKGINKPTNGAEAKPEAKPALESLIESFRTPSKPPSPAVKPKVPRRISISGTFGKDDARQGEPRFGFGDSIQYAMIKNAAEALRVTGAVRHAAESFNFYWPQDLDDEFLVVWEGYAGSPWRYLSPKQLQAFLLSRIEEGFVVPLNPKWILCDPGFFELYKAMEASPETRRALDAWLPPYIRELIDATHDAYPYGFVRTGEQRDSEPEGDAELAELHLRRYHTLRRAKLKLKMILFFIKLARQSREKTAEKNAAAADAKNVATADEPGAEKPTQLFQLDA